MFRALGNELAALATPKAEEREMPLQGLLDLQKLQLISLLAVPLLTLPLLEVAKKGHGGNPVSPALGGRGCLFSLHLGPLFGCCEAPFGGFPLQQVCRIAFNRPLVFGPRQLLPCKFERKLSDCRKVQLQG